MNYMNSAERDTADIKVIDKERWIQHYWNLWYDATDEEQQENYIIKPFTADLIDIRGLEGALRKMKNRKATDIDNLNAEQFVTLQDITSAEHVLAKVPCTERVECG